MTVVTVTGLELAGLDEYICEQLVKHCEASTHEQPAATEVAEEL